VVDGATSNNVKIIFVDAMVLYVVWFKKQWHQSLLHLGLMVSWLINVFQGIEVLLPRFGNKWFKRLII
jgi:hypothetical protein